MIQINRVFAVIFAFILLAGSNLFVDADDAAPIKPSPVTFVRISVGSATQVAGLANDLGIPLPAVATPAGMEQMFPFLGQGSLNADLPVTFDMVAAASDAPQSQREIWYLPINPGRLPISNLQVDGDKLGDDGAIVNGTPFRRVGDYLMFGTTAKGIATLDPTDIPRSLPDHPLFYAEFNTKQLREGAPDQFAAMRKAAYDNKQDAKNPGEAYGSDFAAKMLFDSMDKGSFRIDRTHDALKISTRFEPCAKAEIKTWDVAGMPEGLAGRLDWQLPVHSMATVSRWLSDFEKSGGFYGSADATPEKRDKFVAIQADVLETYLGGEQGSIGLAKSGESGYVVYIATQSSTARDAESDCKRLANEMRFFEGKKDDAKVDIWFTKTGVRVSRLTFDDDEGNVEYVSDMVERNGTRLITWAITANTKMENLLACNSSEKLRTAAAGWVDLPKLLDMRSCFGASAPLTDADKEMLKNVFSGKRIDWTVTVERNQLDASISIQTSMLKNAIANESQLDHFIRQMRNSKDK